MTEFPMDWNATVDTIFGTVRLDEERKALLDRHADVFLKKAYLLWKWRDVSAGLFIGNLPRSLEAAFFDTCLHSLFTQAIDWNSISDGSHSTVLNVLKIAYFEDFRLFSHSKRKRLLEERFEREPAAELELSKRASDSIETEKAKKKSFDILPDSPSEYPEAEASEMPRSSFRWGRTLWIAGIGIFVTYLGFVGMQGSYAPAHYPPATGSDDDWKDASPIPSEASGTWVWADASTTGSGSPTDGTVETAKPKAECPPAENVETADAGDGTRITWKRADGPIRYDLYSADGTLSASVPADGDARYVLPKNYAFGDETETYSLVAVCEDASSLPSRFDVVTAKDVFKDVFEKTRGALPSIVDDNLKLWILGIIGFVGLLLKQAIQSLAVRIGTLAETAVKRFFQLLATVAAWIWGFVVSRIEYRALDWAYSDSRIVRSSVRALMRAWFALPKGKRSFETYANARIAEVVEFYSKPERVAEIGDLYERFKTESEVPMRESGEGRKKVRRSLEKGEAGR